MNQSTRINSSQLLFRLFSYGLFRNSTCWKFYETAVVVSVENCSKSLACITQTLLKTSHLMVVTHEVQYQGKPSWQLITPLNIGCSLTILPEWSLFRFSPHLTRRLFHITDWKVIKEREKSNCNCRTFQDIIVLMIELYLAFNMMLKQKL